jgi:UDP-N-acetylglucosamine:LPS N-acetylglucosamine transferase
MEKKLRICLAASAGGHLTQLLKTAKSWKGYETFFVTTSQAVSSRLEQYGQVYVVGECNRNQPLRLIQVFFRCLGVVSRQRPDVVISTGAAPGLLVCFLAKTRGAKVIWLDSITNVEKLSLSGRIATHFADLVMTQWPELATADGRVRHVGCVV